MNYTSSLFLNKDFFTVGTNEFNRKMGVLLTHCKSQRGGNIEHIHSHLVDFSILELFKSEVWLVLNIMKQKKWLKGAGHNVEPINLLERMV